MKDYATHQGSFDRQIGVAQLATRCRKPRGITARNRLITHPERDAATLAQAGFILGPIANPVFLFGDLMAMSCIVFEGDGQVPAVGEKPL